MRVLVGVTAYGAQKNYILQHFHKMLTQVLSVTEHNVTVLWATDGPAHRIPEYANYQRGTPGLMYADDMLAESRSQFLGYAAEYEYDKLVWHGVDAMYQRPEDFDKLINAEVDGETDIIVAPLINARTIDGYAIARRFEHTSAYLITEHDPIPLTLTQQQYDIPDGELIEAMRLGALLPSGFPGADNMVIDKDYFGIRLPDYKPWYAKVRDGEPNLCFEEEWVLNALRAGGKCFVHAGVRVYHVDGDGTARLYPEQNKRLEDIAWWNL